MNEARYFFVIYLDDERYRSIIDTIRYLANPAEKLSAHITVRGPYQRKQALTKASRALEGAEVSVREVGAFFSEHQQTVFFKCEAPEIQSVWYKPDYPDYIPHVTVYDGASRSFAEKLRVVLSSCPPFSFKANGLVPIKSARGQISMDLEGFYDSRLVKKTTGKDVDPETVRQLSEDERLELISDICSYWTAELRHQEHETRTSRLSPRQSRRK